MNEKMKLYCGDSKKNIQKEKKIKKNTNRQNNKQGTEDKRYNR